MRVRPIVFDWDTRDEDELRANTKMLVRFLSHCKKDERGLLYWDGACQSNGYGHMRHCGSTCLAHRLAYALLVDLVPVDRCVCHHNDDPSCVDPSMLFLGSHSDNRNDMISKGRAPKIVGTMRHNAKITDADVLEIRRKYINGKPNGLLQRDLAKEYNIDRSIICRVINGKRWKHVGVV